MRERKLRPLRPLGIAYLVLSPLVCFALWLFFGVAMGILLILAHGQMREFASLLEGDATYALAIGCCSLPEPLNLATLLSPPALALTIAFGLFHRKQVAGTTARWLAVISLPGNVLGSVWTWRGYFGVDWSGSPNAHGAFQLAAILVVLLPLLWNVFLLWYLAGYPWRWAQEGKPVAAPDRA